MTIAPKSIKPYQRALVTKIQTFTFIILVFRSISEINEMLYILVEFSMCNLFEFPKNIEFLLTQAGNHLGFSVEMSYHINLCFSATTPSSAKMLVGSYQLYWSRLHSIFSFNLYYPTPVSALLPTSTPSLFKRCYSPPYSTSIQSTRRGHHDSVSSASFVRFLSPTA